MTANTPPPKDTYGNTPIISIEGFHWPALAYRSTLVDSDGNEITVLNPIPINQQLPNDLDQIGNVTVGTTAVLVNFTGNIKSLSFTSLFANTGVIYIGKSDVENDGSKHFGIIEGPG